MNSTRKVAVVALSAVVVGCMGPYGPAGGGRGDGDVWPGPGAAMMGGYGPGMMGGYGPGMMGRSGAGMTAGPAFGSENCAQAGSGYGPLAALDLTDEQRRRIDSILESACRTAQQEASAMRENMVAMQALMSAGRIDRKAAVERQRQMQALMGARFERGLALREQIDAVLTDAQRAELARWRGAHRGGAW